MTSRYHEHTIEDIVSITGHSKKKIDEALRKGWFGRVETIKTESGHRYRMLAGAVDNYMKGGYKKTVVKTRDPRRKTPADKALNYYPYQYTVEEADEEARERAKEYCDDEEKMRLERLNKHDLTDEEILEKKYQTFRRQLIGKQAKVRKKRLSVADRREMLALPLNFPTLVLQKLPPEQAVYMMEALFQYIEAVGDDWNEPWVRSTVIYVVRDEIELNKLYDLKTMEEDSVDDKVDEAITRAQNRLRRNQESLGFLKKRGESTGQDGDGDHTRDSWDSGGGMDI